MKTLLKTAAAALLIASSPALTSTAVAQQNCPPGLAKKNPPCVPPGQARQGVTTQEWLNRNNIGSRIGDDDYIYLEDYDDVYYDALPPLGSNEAYVVYDNGVVVLSQTSLTILRLIDILAN
ncbi:hypothetical protein [Yoonia sp.]|uniref:hypothetical protein n=1 Tax=Yoonia sp. TaxID=2212373 RepID=UPI0035C7F08D